MSEDKALNYDSPFRFTDFLLGYGVYAILVAAVTAAAEAAGQPLDIILAGLPLEAIAGALGIFAVVARRNPTSEHFGLPILVKDRLGFLLAIPVALAVDVVRIPVTSGLEELSSPLADRLLTLPIGGEMVLAIISLVVILPLVEEVLFRGVLHAAFRRRWGLWGTVIGSAVTYGAAQLLWVDASVNDWQRRAVATFLAATLFGIVTGVARERTGRIGLGFFIHSGWSALFVLSYFLFEPVT